MQNKRKSLKDKKEIADFDAAYAKKKGEFYEYEGLVSNLTKRRAEINTEY